MTDHSRQGPKFAHHLSSSTLSKFTLKRSEYSPVVIILAKIAVICGLCGNGVAVRQRPIRAEAMAIAIGKGKLGDKRAAKSPEWPGNGEELTCPVAQRSFPPGIAGVGINLIQKMQQSGPGRRELT